MTPRRLLSEVNSPDLTEYQALFELQAEEEKDRELQRKAVSGLKKK
jgi:hypothetical protein